jgi:hypothetical protein
MTAIEYRQGWYSLAAPVIACFAIASFFGERSRESPDFFICAGNRPCTLAHAFMGFRSKRDDDLEDVCNHFEAIRLRNRKAFRRRLRTGTLKFAIGLELGLVDTVRSFV